MNGQKLTRIFINDLSDVHHLCRVCLTESKNMINLYSKLEKKLEKNVSLVFHALTRVVGADISAVKKYPSYICPMCMGILNIAYKFKIQFEQSQNLLKEYFGECQSDEEVFDTKIKTEHDENEENSNKAHVEIISKQGKYDLKDLFIIEEEKEEKPSFKGFLKNLGTEISAKFVRKKETENNGKEDNTSYSITINKINNSSTEIPFINEIPEARILKRIPKVSSMRLKQKSRRFRCNVCEKYFSNKVTLREHRRSHESTKHLCQLCGHIAKSKSGLYNHNISKHQEKKYECKICGKKYLYSSNLQVHFHAIHLQEKSYLCTECGKTFSYSNALVYHMRLHTGEKKYSCTYCDRRFTMIGSLKRHIRTHTGVRPYKCHYCDKAFRSKGEVDCHEMTHTGYRPYTCKHCGKGFTKTHNLKVHLMGHPGPHVCDICFKTFIEMACLKAHLKTVHGMSDEPPELEYETIENLFEG